jgi:hypothetical protein
MPTRSQVHPSGEALFDQRVGAWRMLSRQNPHNRDYARTLVCSSVGGVATCSDRWYAKRRCGSAALATVQTPPVATGIWFALPASEASPPIVLAETAQENPQAGVRPNIQRVTHLNSQSA